MRFRYKGLLVGLAAGAALALTASGAGAASLGGPSGGGGGGGHHHVKLQPQFFTIDLTFKGNNQNPVVNVVNMYGAINALGGTDDEVSNTQGVFTFDQGTITVWHTDVSNAKVDLNSKTCVGTSTALGAWKFVAGTKMFKHVKGFGRFAFFQAIYFKHGHGHGHGDKGKMQSRGHNKCDTKHDPIKVVVHVVGVGKASNGGHSHFMNPPADIQNKAKAALAA
jgi:hypothetical protein